MGQRHYVSVRVVRPDGTARSGVRVSLEVHQFAASGFTRDAKTGSDGLAQLDFDCDSGAQVTVWVDGQVRQPRGPVQARYTVVG